MAFCDRVDEPLRPPVLLETLLDLGMRGARALQVALVHHHNVGEIEHHDLLQLQPAAVIGVHHQHRKIDNSIFLKRHCFLSRADRFDDHIIEIRLREESETIVRRGRKSAGLTTRRHAAHENTVVLRIDHGGAIAQERALTDHAWIMRQNRDASFALAR